MRKYTITVEENGEVNFSNEGLSQGEILYAIKCMEAEVMYPIQLSMIDRVMKKYEEEQILNK